MMFEIIPFVILLEKTLFTKTLQYFFRTQLNRTYKKQLSQKSVSVFQKDRSDDPIATYNYRKSLMTQILFVLHGSQ